MHEWPTLIFSVYGSMRLVYLITGQSEWATYLPHKIAECREQGQYGIWLAGTDIESNAKLPRTAAQMMRYSCPGLGDRPWPGRVPLSLCLLPLPVPYLVSKIMFIYKMAGYMDERGLTAELPLWMTCCMRSMTGTTARETVWTVTPSQNVPAPLTPSLVAATPCNWTTPGSLATCSPKASIFKIKILLQ